MSQTKGPSALTERTLRPLLSLSHQVLQPRCRRMFCAARISDRSGQFSISHSSHSRDAARMGSAAFLAPCTQTSPSSLCMPSTMYRSVSIDSPALSTGFCLIPSSTTLSACDLYKAILCFPGGFGPFRIDLPGRSGRFSFFILQIAAGASVLHRCARLRRSSQASERFVPAAAGAAGRGQAPRRRRTAFRRSDPSPQSAARPRF